MSNSNGRRVMIIGLDGATLDLIQPWAAEGILPNLRRLMEKGAWGPLRTIIPPITPTAWSSFLTGVNPGKHGLFDFTSHKSDSYETLIVNASHRHSPSVWCLLSRAGRRVTVYNVPVTYPVEQVNGLMVGGLLTPAHAKDATWPPELQSELEQAIPGFSFAPPGMYSRGKDLEFVQSVRDLIQTTLRVTRYMMDRQPWDCLVSVFMSTDIMSHFMWKHLETAGAQAPEHMRSVLANAIKDCYRDVDAALGELLKAAGDDTYVVVMSDHGFGRMEKYISVNSWLVDRGYIQFKRDALSRMRLWLYRHGFTPLNIYGVLLRLGFADMIRNTSRRDISKVGRIIKALFLSFRDVDWSRTRAYSSGYSGPIFVNLRGREPQGIVDQGKEYDRVLEELASDLRDLKEPDTGLPFVGDIYRGHSLYTGTHLEQAPDLIFCPRDWKYAGLGLVEFPTNQWLSSSPDRSGHHRLDGIVLFSGPGIRPGFCIQGASIMDIAPTTLALLGVPIPEGMDGHVLANAMSPELLDTLALTYRHEDDSAPVSAPDLTAEEEEIIRVRLRNLGYID